MIPKVLLQTSRHPYPPYLTNMWKERTDDSWKVEWFDDARILKFFDDNPLPQFPKIKEVFNSFTDGGHKADLFRYYYLYLNGGFFVDSDYLTHVHLNEIYSDQYDHLFVLSDIECNKKYHPEIDSPLIFNGFMGCIPKSTIVYQALVDIYNVKPRLLEKQRLYVTYMLYVIAKKNEGSSKIKWLHEVLPYQESIISYTYDEHQKKIGTHYFSGRKTVPHQHLRTTTLVPKQTRNDAASPLDVTFFTTFNDVGYQVYGRAWITTFIQTVAKYPHLRAKVYYEDFEPDIIHPAIEYRKFSEYIPQHADWKMRYAVLTPHMRYTKACTIRFSHKAFVMQHMWETTPTGYAIWLDGDCTFKDHDFSSFPYDLVKDTLLACQVEIRVDTPVRHVESGVVIMNCAHYEKPLFLEKFKENYTLPQIMSMPNDCYDTRMPGTWREYGPYDGFIIHKSLVGSGVSFVDLNDCVRDANNADYTAHPEHTFLNPELYTRFIHNIGHEGKNRYEQVNSALNIDKQFSWNSVQTDDVLTYTLLKKNDYPNVIEIESPEYGGKRFPFFIYNPLTDKVISHHICSGQPWKRSVSDLIISSMKPGGVFVDVGANIGWHTKVVQNAGYDVIAFEPQPITASVLEMNCAKKGSTLHTYALGDKTGPSLIACNYENYGEAFLSDSGDNRVHVVMLDHIIDEATVSRVNAIKIDVCGDELKIVRGGKRFFEVLPKGCVIIINIDPIKQQDQFEVVEHLLASSTRSYVMDFEDRPAKSFVEEVELCRTTGGNFDLVLIK